MTVDELIGRWHLFFGQKYVRELPPDFNSLVTHLDREAFGREIDALGVSLEDIQGAVTIVDRLPAVDGRKKEE